MFNFLQAIHGIHFVVDCVVENMSSAMIVSVIYAALDVLAGEDW